MYCIYLHSIKPLQRYKIITKFQGFLSTISQNSNCFLGFSHKIPDFFTLEGHGPERAGTLMHLEGAGILCMKSGQNCPLALLTLPESVDESTIGMISMFKVV